MCAAGSLFRHLHVRHGFRPELYQSLHFTRSRQIDPDVYSRVNVSARVDDLTILHQKVLPLLGVGGSPTRAGVQRLLFKRRSIAATQQLVTALSNSGGKLSRRELLQMIRLKMKSYHVKTDWEAVLKGAARGTRRSAQQLSLLRPLGITPRNPKHAQKPQAPRYAAFPSRGERSRSRLKYRASEVLRFRGRKVLVSKEGHVLLPGGVLLRTKMSTSDSRLLKNVILTREVVESPGLSSLHWKDWHSYARLYTRSHNREQQSGEHAVGDG